jgi:hypothetical protein
MYYHKSIDIIGEELKTTQENLKDKNIPFNHKIELMNVGFHYQFCLKICPYFADYFYSF